MYSYSGADLTAIHRLANVVFKAGAASVTVPGYSMNFLTVALN
jgi:hypothetical protein